mgnify:CR=1 FL=1
MIPISIFRYAGERAEREALENLRLQDEIRFLKTQIDPHFFMNMLNNIHAMVEIDPHKAQEVIIGLSKLMRYSLYDAEKDLAPLNDELDFLKNYINLMMVRYPEDVVEINMNIPAHPSSSVMIPPLLFMPLIENAFKHGISFQVKSLVKVSFRWVGDKVCFTCMNTLPPVSQKATDVSGIGLDNVKRRLDLLYSDRYEWNIERNTEKYNVELILPSL